MTMTEAALRRLLSRGYLSHEPRSMDNIFAYEGTDNMRSVVVSDLKRGMSEAFIDSLPRVHKSMLKEDECCAICQCAYLEEEYPLVAQLPGCKHMFDLECLSIWLRNNDSCPMCRADLRANKMQIDTSQCELEEHFNMYG